MLPVDGKMGGVHVTFDEPLAQISIDNVDASESVYGGIFIEARARKGYTFVLLSYEDAKMFAEEVLSMAMAGMKRKEET